jgi:hypothetical protein
LAGRRQLDPIETLLASFKVDMRAIFIKLDGRDASSGSADSNVTMAAQRAGFPKTIDVVCECDRGLLLDIARVFGQRFLDRTDARQTITASKGASV